MSFTTVIDGFNKKQTGDFFKPKTLRDRFSGVNTMKNFLGIDRTTKLSRELPTDLQMERIPLKDLLSLAEDIHIKTREASQNTDLDM